MKSDGTVWAWGRNDSGQLGDGTTVNRSAPSQVSNLTGVIQISGGGNHSLALKSDGTVWAWGNNGSGQLGDGTTANRLAPTLVPNLTGVVQVSAGGNHSLVVKVDGTVWGWGYNQYGQLGDGTSDNKLTPVQVQGITGATQVSSGEYHSLALKADGTALGWGWNGGGQLGDGTTNSKQIPAKVQGLIGAFQIAASGSSSYAVSTPSASIPATTTSVAKKTVPAGLLTLLEAKLTIKGTATPAEGQSLYFSVDGIDVGGGVTDSLGVARVSVVLPSSLGVHNYRADFTGSAFYGRSSGASTLTLISSAVRGNAYTWGWNQYGLLGNGTQVSTNVATQVKLLPKVAQIAGGYRHSLALKSDGTVWAWGYNDQGQLGDGTSLLRTTPVQVSGLTGAVQVAGGEFHSLALKSDGTVWAWGANWNGSLGDGTHNDSHAPIQVHSLSSVVQIAGGAYHSLALKSDGTVWAWGANQYYGQLGDGTTTERDVPVQVVDISGIVQVAGGGYFSLALKSDGTVWAWGENAFGGLGDGTETNRKRPVQVAGLANVVQLSAGWFHTLALKSDGTVWAWGNNQYGQLGDGTGGDGGYNFNKNVPVQVPSLSGIQQVAGGYWHSLALKSDGTVWVSGRNWEGEVGDGTGGDGSNSFNRNTPVQALALTGQTYIAGGVYHSLSLTAVPRNTITSTSSLKATYGATILLTGKLRLAGVVTLPVKPLVFSIDGVVVGTATTDASGTARLALASPLAPGTHALGVAFAGDPNFNASGASGTVTVKAATTLSQKSVSGNMGSAVNLAATLTRTIGGALLANKTVAFYVDGSNVGTATTDANGVATLSYTITQMAGKYALKVTFDGDDGYLASSFTRASLVVK